MPFFKPMYHVPALPHVRPLHQVRLHSGPGLLRPPGRFPRQVPPGREGARLRRRLAPLGRLRGPRARSHGPGRHRSHEHPRRHVLRLRRRGRARSENLSSQPSKRKLMTSRNYFLKPLRSKIQHRPIINFCHLIEKS